MKENLVMKLNTRENMQVASQESGLYAELSPDEAGRYIKKSFDKAISYCLTKNEESTLEEEAQLVNEIRRMMGENSLDKPFEINVYDENRQLKRKVGNERSTVMHLEDEIEPYVDSRAVANGDVYNYLDMVVCLNSKVGR